MELKALLQFLVERLHVRIANVPENEEMAQYILELAKK